ncbi:MAG: tRNA (adenosine(37)-N6)-dimethylallyltransferase MiaA [Flavitalea sp.]
MSRKLIILISGPTASGKTDIAIHLAQAFHTEIISADSRQCFKELNIGVAKPSAEQLTAVKHYFINSHSITETVNAATFEKYALGAAQDIFQHRDVVIMVGGTGLYIQAFCKGMDEIPEIPAHIRDQIISSYKQHGMEWLQQQIEKHDIVYFTEGEMHNPQRMMRALEVQLSTGHSIKEFQQKKSVERDFNVLKFAIDIPREQLYKNINTRVDEMMQMGLLKEVISLMPFKQLNALQTVGYSELFAFLENKSDLNEAIGKIKTNTRHYAKRQLTWFQKDPEIKWMPKELLLEFVSNIKI